MAVRVYMLRHGESVSNADPQLAALPQAEGDRLTERGMEEARAAAAAMRQRGVTKLLHSPLRRAAETAKPIGELLGLEPIELDYVHELREPVGYGHLDAEQQRLQRWSERMHEHRDDPDYSSGGSESFNDVLARVRHLKGELETTIRGEVPLLVTHGIFLRFFLFDSLLGDAFGPGLSKRMWHLRSVNCGLSVFESGERWHPMDAETPGWTCLAWMERPWDPW
ncbi:MAG: histidine phosphatase family protein [Solirubrobacterales bacterium]